MTTDLRVAGESFPVGDVKAVIAGYCFGEETTQPDPPVPAYGEPLPAWLRSRFGYRSYDCQRGPGEGIDIVDIVAPVLLNVTQGYGVEIVSNLLAVAPIVNEVVRQVPADVSFWTLPRGELENPPEGSPVWLLHRAWCLIESVPGCGVTKTHKVLHHAWPHLFPLIDTQRGRCSARTCGSRSTTTCSEKSEPSMSSRRGSLRGGIRTTWLTRSFAAAKCHTP